MLMMCSLLYFTNSTSSFRFEASKTSFSDSYNLDLQNNLDVRTYTIYKKKVLESQTDILNPFAPTFLLF